MYILYYRLSYNSVTTIIYNNLEPPKKYCHNRASVGLGCWAITERYTGSNPRFGKVEKSAFLPLSQAVNPQQQLLPGTDDVD